MRTAWTYVSVEPFHLFRYVDEQASGTTTGTWTILSALYLDATYCRAAFDLQTIDRASGGNE